MRRNSLLSAGVLVAGLTALNIVAYRHARAMTHFSPAGVRMVPPERMTPRQKIGVLFSGVTLTRAEDRETPRDFGLAYETVHFPGRAGLDVESWLVPSPRSRGIVLLFHGYGAKKSLLLTTAAEFHALGYDALLVGFNGSGRSLGDDTSIGYHEAEVVAQAARWAALRWPERKPILFGVSMGAAAVLRAVGVLGVESSGIIVAAPFDRLLTSAKRRFEKMGLPAFPFAQLLVFWGGVQEGYDGFSHNPVEYARGVHCPALLLFGDQDAYITLADTRGIYDALSGPKTLKVFAGLKHEDYARASPKEWRVAVKSFLAGKYEYPPNRP